MRYLLGLSAALLLATDGISGQAPATSPAQLAASFGALQSISQISLSPDAGKIAYLGHVGETQALFVADLVAGGPVTPIVKAPGDGGTISWCGWSGPERLVCSVNAVVDDAGVLLGFSRMIAVDADGKRLVKLTQETTSKSMGIMQYGGDVLDWDVPGEPGKVLMTRQYVPDKSMGTNIHSDLEGLGVDLVDTVTLKRTKVEGPRRGAVEYFTDGRGEVRVMGVQGQSGQGYARTRIAYSFRRPRAREWEPLGAIDLKDESEGGFEPVAVDGTSNSVFGFDFDRGMIALFSIALDGTGKRTKVLGRSEVDIDQIVTLGRDHRVVGASYATERRTVEYFDPELAALSKALTKALPGNPNVDFIDAAADGKKLLLLAWSDINPGMLYLFDKTSRQLEELLPVRAELQGMPLAPMKPVTYKAADGTEIPAYLTLPPGSNGKGLPAIVMPHGGPGSRDEWGFDWLVQYFAARGYAVLQPNFRGSAGYGSAWYQQNGFKSWRVAVGDVNDAGRWLVQQGIAAPDKLGVVGWSYGGYAALQSAVLDPDLFKAIVAVAPVTDLERLRQEASDYSNFPLVDAFIGNGPHVREGSPAQNAKLFKAPVLLFHGTMDQNVGVGESRLMNDRLRGAGKSVSYIEFPGLDHSLTNRSARIRLLSESDSFLRRAFGI